jgi:hypothetical protein
MAGCRLCGTRLGEATQRRTKRSGRGWAERLDERKEHDIVISADLVSDRLARIVKNLEAIPPEELPAAQAVAGLSKRAGARSAA